jgi:hypothetical protein
MVASVARQAVGLLSSVCPASRSCEFGRRSQDGTGALIGNAFSVWFRVPMLAHTRRSFLI